MNREVVIFEQRFSQWAGGGACFSFWKGRVALYALLKGMGVGRGDEVILPGYTCVMDVNPIMYLGARPVYVDIRPENYNMDLDALSAAITPRTRVIIAQHTYGIPCDMDRLMMVANARGVAVVEDCCLALGSTYRGKPCGSIGKAAYWSFQWNKTMTTGLGGMAAVHDPRLVGSVKQVCEGLLRPSGAAAALLGAERMAHGVMVHPRTAMLATKLFRTLTRRGMVIGSSSSCEFQPVEPEGFFTGMSAGQARAGLRGLNRLARNIAHRCKIAAFYEARLKERGMAVQQVPEGGDPVYVRYPVRVKDKAAVLQEAARKGIEIGSWFESPLHPAETPLERYGYRLGQCPHAELAAQEVVNLPTHARVSERVAERCWGAVEKNILH